MSWNVRRLNSSAKREDIKQVISTFRPDIICIQETKLAVITPSIVRETLGADFQDSFVFLPTIGTRGGILVAARLVCSSCSNLTPPPTQLQFQC
jgi:exonuclease III